ncbi:hypothetical protein BJ878DRAFT_569269 [Calycina marina]|uniref:Symplekin/Pta1 N-terminal domain-containing protein n=1 Tax=Calycina marina TaxID=1763456 RepID=A0A9P7Z0B4_9HELO|nr:hypothetical protein BJ878DRAFT_569269 [Calycina marina]
MATTTAYSLTEQLANLESARILALSDANFYPSIISTILPIVGRDAPQVELRRWGADFLAETFANPTLSGSMKETLSVTALDCLKGLVEREEDGDVLKGCVMMATSVYPWVVRWIVNNPYDTHTWEKMSAIKARILRIWDSTAIGVRLCCIKFAQKVVSVQTAGNEADPRRDPRDINLAMIPPNNAILVTRNLEAEASGLLDRLLSIFQESPSDAILIDATINSLATLIRARPQLSNKILNALLSFNPLKQANSPMTSKLRVVVKSMEKTVRLLLIHILKRDPQNPSANKIHQYIEKMSRSRIEIFEEASRKRGPPEPTDALDAAKRQRIETQASKQMKLHVPLLSDGPHTVAELFTIGADAGLQAFDVSTLEEDMAIKISVLILQKTDPDILNQAIQGIRQRFAALLAPPPHLVVPPIPEPQQQPVVPEVKSPLLGVDDEDDDYEPDLYPTEDTEQILNKLDNAPHKGPEPEPKSEYTEIAPFTLPNPPALSAEETNLVGNGTVARVFGVMSKLEDASKKPKSGINRLAAGSSDKDAWITIISRLATRSTFGIDRAGDSVKSEATSLNETIRQSLYGYTIADFRKRIDIAVAWLCEEWYNDQLQNKSGDDGPLHYEYWALKIFDGFKPYLDARDKILTRFLGEIPELSVGILERVKNLCSDPAMVNLALTSLLYLVIMRPPVREAALDAVEEIWATYDDAKTMAAKYLIKWRPGFEARYKAEEEKTYENESDSKVDEIMADAARVNEAAS